MRSQTRAHCDALEPGAAGRGWARRDKGRNAASDSRGQPRGSFRSLRARSDGIGLFGGTNQCGPDAENTRAATETEVKDGR